MKTSPSNEAVHEHIWVQGNGSRCSELMSQNLKHLGLTKASLLIQQLNSGTIMSVCRQWRIMVSCKFMATFLEKKTVEGFIQYDNAHNAKKYKHPMQCKQLFQYHQEGVWLAPCLFCSWTMIQHIQTFLITSGFSVKNSRGFWRWWHRPQRTLISASWCVFEITWEDWRIWGRNNHRRPVVIPSRCLEEPAKFFQRFVHKYTWKELMLFWK